MALPLIDEFIHRFGRFRKDDAFGRRHIADLPLRLTLYELDEKIVVARERLFDLVKLSDLV